MVRKTQIHLRVLLQFYQPSCDAVPFTVWHPFIRSRSAPLCQATRVTVDRPSDLGVFQFSWWSTQGIFFGLSHCLTRIPYGLNLPPQSLEGEKRQPDTINPHITWKPASSSSINEGPTVQSFGNQVVFQQIPAQSHKGARNYGRRRKKSFTRSGSRAK